ncbi:hypothetical protein FIM06_1722 [Bacillus velezensis]|nr:hypothetical protein FIM06_1722 [Bacillus velezensis]QDF52432.1 hypothetical protein D069_1721 [Bacillus velezensis]
MKGISFPLSEKKHLKKTPVFKSILTRKEPPFISDITPSPQNLRDPSNLYRFCSIGCSD